jgi:hypothetical protein
MDKRYQVFVSSTFVDLVDERQEIMQALLELDCIPAGMELFSAADEDQWSLIKRVIDDCDYYVLVLGGRYGSIGPDGFSYTQMEYQYALDQGKPVIGFLHKDPGSIIADKTEKSEEGKQKLAAFRELVQKKLCKFWETPAELGSVVSRSLVKLIKDKPGIGWVRGNLVPDQNATEEMLRLRQQIDSLKEELNQTRSIAVLEVGDLAHGEDVFAIGYSFTAYVREEAQDCQFQEYHKANWNDIFARISPMMIDDIAEGVMKAQLSQWLREIVVGDIVATHHVHPQENTISIDLDDFNTIKIQLIALGLIEKSEKAKGVNNRGAFWTLTKLGEATMMKLRAIRRVE